MVSLSLRHTLPEPYVFLFRHLSVFVAGSTRTSMFSRGAVLTLAYLLTTVLAGTWKECDSYSGKSFLSGFNHMSIPDPTHGRVYVLPPLYP